MQKGEPDVPQPAAPSAACEMRQGTRSSAAMRIVDV